MIEHPIVGDAVLVMKGGGTAGTVLGFWDDAETGIEWVVLRVHEWSDENRAWTPTTRAVPLLCERESLTHPMRS